MFPPSGASPMPQGMEYLKLIIIIIIIIISRAQISISERQIVFREIK